MFLFVACAIALGEQAPRRGQLLPTASGFRFTCAATVRVVDRIAGNTTVNRTDTAMTRATRFAQNHVFMLGITDLTDGRVAIFINATDFAGRKADLRVALVTRHQSGSTAGSADHLSAATRGQFDIVNRETHRDSAERERVANFSGSGRTAHQ